MTLNENQKSYFEGFFMENSIELLVSGFFKTKFIFSKNPLNAHK